jgi:hypothetical protein
VLGGILPDGTANGIVGGIAADAFGITTPNLPGGVDRWSQLGRQLGRARSVFAVGLGAHFLRLDLGVLRVRLGREPASRHHLSGRSRGPPGINCRSPSLGLLRDHHPDASASSPSDC